MGVRDVRADFPDLLNLPVYSVNRTMEERVGDTIRVVHGYVSFGQTIWTHIEVWDIADMMLTAGRCTELSMRPKCQRGPKGH